MGDGMANYGTHMRVSKEFKSVIHNMKVDLAVKEGRKFSDVEITRLITKRLNSKGIVLDWRVGWK